MIDEGTQVFATRRIAGTIAFYAEGVHHRQPSCDGLSSTIVSWHSLIPSTRGTLETLKP